MQPACGCRADLCRSGVRHVTGGLPRVRTRVWGLTANASRWFRGKLRRRLPPETPAYRSGIGRLRSTDTAVTAFCGLPSITRSL
jgi:hypothetical protein